MTQNLDHGRMFRPLLTHLSIAFDFLRQDIIIDMLYAYGFDMKVVDFIYYYLGNR